MWMCLYEWIADGHRGQCKLEEDTGSPDWEWQGVVNHQT